MKKISILLIKFYQYFISPVLAPACRYSPSCSEYTLQAIKQYGAVKGVWLGAKRILRCNPLSVGGYDPLPCCSKPATTKK